MVAPFFRCRVTLPSQQVCCWNYRSTLPHEHAHGRAHAHTQAHTQTNKHKRKDRHKHKRAFLYSDSLFILNLEREETARARWPPFPRGFSARLVTSLSAAFRTRGSRRREARARIHTGDTFLLFFALCCCWFLYFRLLLLFFVLDSTSLSPLFIYLFIRLILHSSFSSGFPLNDLSLLFISLFCFSSAALYSFCSLLFLNSFILLFVVFFLIVIIILSPNPSFLFFTFVGYFSFHYFSFDLSCSHFLNFYSLYFLYSLLSSCRCG